MSDSSSLKIAQSEPLYQTPTGAIEFSRHGQGEMPPGVRLGMTNSRSFFLLLVAPLSMNVESPLVLPLVGRHRKCEVTVTFSPVADGTKVAGVARPPSDVPLAAGAPLATGAPVATGAALAVAANPAARTAAA